MRHKLPRLALVLFSVAVIVSMTVGSSAFAASSTKAFSTNFTLVNLGSTDAQVVVDYVQPDGSAWTGSAFTSLTVTANGGQQIVRQYADTLTPGQGSVVISSSQPLGALVQIQNRVGVPSTDAYIGVTAGTSTAYIPLAAHHGSSASGTANSQIMIQNTGSSPIDVTVALTKSGSATSDYTKTISGIAASATFTYDLEGETHLSENWFGSAAVNVTTSGGKVAVLSSLFFGPDSMVTFNAFPIETLDSKWFIPLLYSRLTNTLTTSLAIQNLDGAPIPANDLVLSCTKDPTSLGAATLTVSNASVIPDKSAYYFNTYTDHVNFPDNWYGGCILSSTGGHKVVTFIQYRYISTADQAAYGAIPSLSTDKTLYVPLVAKRLSNGFATTATIQNLSTTNTATMTLTYTPSGGGTSIVRPGVTIPPGASIIRNFRQGGTEAPDMPDGWVGTLKVSSDQPIQAYLANTYTTPPTGDRFAAYQGFTTP